MTRLTTNTPNSVVISHNDNFYMFVSTAISQNSLMEHMAIVLCLTLVGTHKD